jgi:6-phosphogluconolactonase
MIRIEPDPETLSLAAAGLVADAARTAVAGRGRFTLAVAGGTTPLPAYRRLADPTLASGVPWPKVHVFWGDERCVPPDDPSSNERAVHEALLDRVPVPADHIHPIRCAGDPARAALAYDALLRSFVADSDGPTLDLVLLGLGENGHTASLFPGDPALQETSRWVVPARVAGQAFARVTLTAGVLNRARAVVFLVSGSAKAGVLRQVLEGPRRPERLPAQLIRPRFTQPLWLVDAEAASQLSDAKDSRQEDRP